RRAEIGVGQNGLGWVDATVSAFAAADLDATLSYGAAQLKAAGSAEDLDARRSYALEDVIAAAHDPETGQQGAFDLTDGQAGATGEALDSADDPTRAGAADGLEYGAADSGPVGPAPRGTADDVTSADLSPFQEPR